MANGHRALSLVSEPPAAPAPPTERPTLVQEKIGQAVADAASLLCAGVFELQGGGLGPAIKAEGGRRIARLFELQQTHATEIDFSAAAREHGRIALRRQISMDVYRTYGPAAGEATINAILDEVLTILGHVTACEKALAN